MRRRILVICTGNLCRSPMAAVYLRARARNLSLDLEVRSAGIMAVSGRVPPEPARRFAESLGMDLNTHTATPVTPTLMHWADHVLVMEPWQKEWLLTTQPEMNGKIDVLSNWLAGGDPEGHGIPDPFGADPETYEQIGILLRQALDNWLEERLGPGVETSIIEPRPNPHD